MLNDDPAVLFSVPSNAPYCTVSTGGKMLQLHGEYNAFVIVRNQGVVSVTRASKDKSHVHRAFTRQEQCVADVLRASQSITDNATGNRGTGSITHLPPPLDCILMRSDTDVATRTACVFCPAALTLSNRKNLRTYLSGHFEGVQRMEAHTW